MGLLWVLLVFVVSSGASAYAFRPANAGTPSFVIAILAASAVLAGAAIYKAQRDGELTSWVKPRWGDFSGGALTAAALFAATYGIGKLLAPEGSPRAAWLYRLYLQLGSPEILREKASLVAAVVVVFAITDALAWRGLVSSLLAERFGSRTAWIWAGALYGLSYLPAAYVLREEGVGPNLVLVITALMMGFVLGATTRVFRRLVPGMVGHALFAWFTLMTYRLLSPSV